MRPCVIWCHLLLPVFISLALATPTSAILWICQSCCCLMAFALAITSPGHILPPDNTWITLSCSSNLSSNITLSVTPYPSPEIFSPYTLYTCTAYLPFTALIFFSSCLLTYQQSFYSCLHYLLSISPTQIKALWK